MSAVRSSCRHVLSTYSVQCIYCHYCLPNCCLPLVLFCGQLTCCCATVICLLTGSVRHSVEGMNYLCPIDLHICECQIFSLLLPTLLEQVIWQELCMCVSLFCNKCSSAETKGVKNSMQTYKHNIQKLRDYTNTSAIHITVNFQNCSKEIFDVATVYILRPVHAERFTSRRRASTRPHLAYLQVMYAYSSSCQLRHCQFTSLSMTSFSTDVVWWWSPIATRTFWPFIVIGSLIAYV